MFADLCHYTRLDLADLPEIMLIERHASNRPWSAAMVRDSIQCATSQVWGMRFNKTQELIGFSIISIVCEEAELLLMAIKKDHQSKGFGGMMVNFILEQVKMEGVTSLYLDVAQYNEIAQHLYLKKGFVQHGIRQEYYADEDALMYQLEL